EDGPMRLPDTMRVSVKLIEVGVLKRVDVPKVTSQPSAALVVEDWIVGQAAPAAEASPAPATANNKDWGKLDGANQKDFAPVVPPSPQSGEISIPPLPPELAGDKTVPMPQVEPEVIAVPVPPPVAVPVPVPAPAPPPPPVAASVPPPPPVEPPKQ